MIIYSNNKKGFIEDIPRISSVLKKNIEEKLGELSSEGEIRSWDNSLRFMSQVISANSVPDDAGIALEYNIPVTNNRIDFIITGTDEEGQHQAVLVELKQWQHVMLTDMDGVVKTYYEDGLRDTPHPSYQVASYASLLYDFKASIQEREVMLHPCVYMHNFTETDVINDNRYKRYLRKAPVFCKDESTKLLDFINTYIRKGDRSKSIYMIEDSEIKPSKSLMDSVVSMSQGNPVFKMIDDQKVVYQNIIHAYEDYCSSSQKKVVIVNGGPGTGKSVIAVKLLVDMTMKGKIAHYVSKNAAPRNVFYKKFMERKGVRSSIQNLFKSSGKYFNENSNQFDMLIVDEAHRLVEKSGIFSNLGENQVKEIINSSKVSVFFIDENQRISLLDIGTNEEIKRWAQHFGADIIDMNLRSQFRCSGSDEYMRWLDRALQIDTEQAFKLSGTTYDFKVFDSPTEMMEQIREHNRYRHKSRMVAGYCWPWKSRNNSREKDIVFEEYGFSYKWNLANDNTWSISPGSINQIGCIHTCQGLEFDYVGVIIGEDMICRDRQILVNPAKRATDDFSVRGWRKMMEKDPSGTKVLMRQIIKNTYRTLMTRGMKGCYIWCQNKELNEYFKSLLN